MPNKIGRSPDRGRRVDQSWGRRGQETDQAYGHKGGMQSQKQVPRLGIDRTRDDALNSKRQYANNRPRTKNPVPLRKSDRKGGEKKERAPRRK